MKATLALLLLFTFQLSIAQEVADEPPSDELSTTIEEYNYITKGYKAQVIDQGGDLKRGYSLEVIDDKMKVSTFTFGLSLFKRDATNEYCALMVTAKSASSGRTYYFCVPINNPDLTKKYYSELNALDCVFQTEYARLSSSMMPMLIAHYVKQPPKKK